ncbi:hypothetical protein WN51_13379 [Melipona quadrifasciata]|uniref:Uncharacterized protein n=1 Tax=Melipona quadrifasciata TaxID=166423 RepID=A0A0N0BGU5_9HYME|nr:hypothetical protein WN51_13379 [Melipona quadrifasciata]
MPLDGITAIAIATKSTSKTSTTNSPTSVTERGHDDELKTTKFKLFGHDPCPGRYSTRKEKYKHGRSVPRLIRISQRTDP